MYKPAQLLFVAIVLLIACNSSNERNTNDVAFYDSMTSKGLEADPVENQYYNRNEITKDVIAQIVDYYREEYGNDSVAMDVLRSDTLIELRFVGVLESSEDFQRTLLVAYIPLINGAKATLTGDLDGDESDDLVVSILTEGGGVGGNSFWKDHFLFLQSDNGTYHLNGIEHDGEINNGRGYFTFQEISQGSIQGTSLEYNEDDGHCCPSLHYDLTLHYSNGKLLMLSKKAKNE